MADSSSPAPKTKLPKDKSKGSGGKFIAKESKRKVQKGPPESGKAGGSETSRRISDKAGLVFPVSRISKALKKGGYAKRLGLGAPVYLTAVLEYLTAEILELAGNAAKDQKKQRIIPRHLQLAVRNDEELNKYLGNVTICGGGVIPNIHSVLLPKKTGGKEGAGGSFSQEF
eukprot:gnl/TRDRNA2_/TRDRNA2_181858_c0_seq1.p1 gnl/TRDRNA2_/TRDRNA2_181858_c0~~gnl/TRDRNA2_/TRDRNA2_181858_c0_seq1.p1  ORF type:complete len:171 (-),score=50.02 gnl/TRDRNA2_/TRDRNA2_181858_c0_seq1:213-725(-)